MAITEQDLKVLPEMGIDPENPGIYQGLLEDLQGNILKGHGRDYSVFLFMQWKSDKIPEAKQWIKEFTQIYVTSAKSQSDEAVAFRQNQIPGSIFANIFLTRFGYDALGFEGELIPFDQPFRMGMKNEQIRTALGDPVVQEWEEGYQDEIHSLLLLADDDIIDLLQTVNKITQKLTKVATLLHREDGFILRNKAGQIIEHFGFVDGVSQPLFLKRDIVTAQINNCDFSKWDPRSSLDIILVKDPNGKTEDSYGSYLVYRKLEQNVKAFREDQKQLAKSLSINEDLAGAYVVGRFPDGTPVTKSDIPTYAVTSTNNFNYDEDVNATKCPFHAHVRKTNPRSDTVRQFNVSLEEEKGHQIARRAVSYGENDPSQEPEKDAGLLFLCFQANIENQFNFMQIRWSNADGFVKVGVGPDPLIGQPEGKQQWPKKWGEDEIQEYSFKLWVFMKGGEYFFAPSISFLLGLA